MVYRALKDNPTGCNSEITQIKRGISCTEQMSRLHHTSDTLILGSDIPFHIKLTFYVQSKIKL